MVKEELISDLKKNIMKTLNLQDLDPEVFGDNTPLFSEDGLELVVMVENSYGITIGDKDEAKSIFASVSSLADYILAKGK